MPESNGDGAGPEQGSARRGRVLDSAQEARELLGRARRLAVLGIKTERQAGQPAYYVPAYLQRAGYTVVPVPVYYPDVEEILGERAYRRLVDIPDEIDMVVVFRRSVDLPGHVADIVAKAPASVWFQSGIRHDGVAAQLAAAGIDVVQDRCTMVDHRFG
jgi:uncharacterized protein